MVLSRPIKKQSVVLITVLIDIGFCMEKIKSIPKEKLLEIKALAEAATPGPVAKSHRIRNRRRELKRPCAFKGRVSAQENDADFIASAREDVPALLAEVERLRKQLDGLTKIAAFSMGCTSHPQWEKKYKLQWGMEIFEKSVLTK